MSLYDELWEKFKALCDEAHAKGATVIVGLATYDPKRDQDKTCYLSAGSFLACYGLVHQVIRQMDDSEDDENT